MDILRFVNSKDIREHLRKLNYQFTTTEAAWMVWQSKYASLEEKHKAWEEIIETMPDCAIEKRLNTEAHPSLHKFLRELMTIQEQEIQKLMTPEANGVYSYRVRLYDEDEWFAWNDELSFSFSRCLENAIVMCKEFRHYYKEMTDEDFLISCRIQIKKVWVDEDAFPIVVEYDGLGKCQDIIKYRNLDEKAGDIICYGFDGMWFAFPTPFKKGDILKGVNSYDEAFVFVDLDADSDARERLEKNGDCSDMVARGYFQDPDDGEIYYECMHDYMALEYYRGEFVGVQRALKALSNYLKGQISIDLYANAYRTILAEEHNKQLFPTWITDEGLKLAGLKE